MICSSHRVWRRDINILIPRGICVNSSVIDNTIIFLNSFPKLVQMVKNTLAF